MVLTRKRQEPSADESVASSPAQAGRKRQRGATSNAPPQAKRRNGNLHQPSRAADAAFGKSSAHEISSHPARAAPVAIARAPPNQTGVEDNAGQEHAPVTNFESNGSSISRQQNNSGMLQRPEFMPQGPSIQVRLQSLPVLENLAAQVLSIIAKLSYPEVINMAIKKDSDAGKTYVQLRNLFNHAKQVYSDSDPFLNARALGFVNHTNIETIRKTNIATFMISVLGSQDVGFYHLNEYFLDTFLAEGQPLSMPLGELLIELKTQAYISALSTKDRPREAILDDLFSQDLGERFLRRRPGARQLTQSEEEFMQRFEARRKALLDEPQTEAAMNALPEKYVWADFLREISAYLSSNIDSIMRGQPPHGSRNAQHSVPEGDDDIAGKAQRAAQYAMRDYGSGAADEGQSSNSLTSTSYSGPELQFHFENELHPNVPGPEMPFFGPHTDVPLQWTPSSEHSHYVPYPTQSAPSHVLYERARVAAASKSTPQSARKPPQPSTRRPWTLEEENALMAGLDRVRGPHWSQIIGMFGKGGSISEVLKDRGQVNLKDKARNLKLFFLKHDIEVPYYLQCVTGELKTRAPGTAAKKEARTRGLSDDDRAHVEGIMALANSSQQRIEDQGSSEPAKAPEPNMNTDNVDPSLSSMSRNSLGFAARTFNADWIMPMGNAPSANMTSDHSQSQQGTQH